MTDQVKKKTKGAIQLARLVEAVQFVKRTNCLLVQADIDRTGRATVGTCWWDTAKERLLPTLPESACWVCKLKDALKKFEEASHD